MWLGERVHPVETDDGAVGGIYVPDLDEGEVLELDPDLAAWLCALLDDAMPAVAPSERTRCPQLSEALSAFPHGAEHIDAWFASAPWRHLRASGLLLV